MNENKTALLKIFSAVLRERSKSEPQYQSISPEMVKHFSRKELIEIISHIYQDEETPWEGNLVAMENEELLLLIRDDYSIISYVVNYWSKEISQLPTLQEWMKSKTQSSENDKENSISESPNSLDASSEETEKLINPDEISKGDLPNLQVQNSEQENEQKKKEEKPTSKKPEKAKNT